jgi:hypothetical protein
VNADPAAGVAARSITVPDGNVEEQALPQLIPLGVLVTVPVPVPERLTERAKSGTNVAVTAVFALSVTLHVPMPEHGEPLQPAKEEPALATGVRVITVPESNSPEQVVPQLIPAGALVIVPLPAPALVSDNVNRGVGGGPKFATTDWFADIVTAQAPVPVHAPLQPVKAEPAAGVAVRLTAAPDPNVEEQVVPQLIPVGRLVMLPVPVPDLLIFNVYVGRKVAVTSTSEVTVTEHDPVPEQAAPLQPANTDPAAATGVRVTIAPELKGATQDAPQLMPAGALVMVPEPLPFTATERLNCGAGAGPKFAITV